MRYNELMQGACNALIWNRRDDTYLFLLRSDLVNHPLQWCLPGGHIEAGEDPIDALHRELGEEIGRDLRDHEITKLTETETHEPHFIHRNYAIRVDGPFDPDLNWEHVDHRWATLEEMPTPNIWSLDMLLSNDDAAKILKHWQDKQRKAG